MPRASGSTTALPTIARRVAALGLPKLYAPTVATDESGGIRFTARLSVGAPVDGHGDRRERRTSSGAARATGAAVDWTWLPAAPVPAGTQWRIETPGATAGGGTSSSATAAATARG